MAGLKLQAVTKSYDGKTPVIKQIDLDVADGEFIVMVGPSGCGKSTLLRMVAGLERTTSGDIYIDTRRVTDLEPKDRGIAMVFQNYALYPHMSVYDNMAYGLKIRGFGKEHIRQRVEEAARILELEPLLKRKPRELSGGQRQRVAMGRAIVREPAVFLFDEPLSNLDAKLRVQMRLELQQLHRRLKTTSLYVTHDQVEAMTLAQRVIVMNKGVAEQIGTPSEVYQRPASLFVAGFIGSPAMNLLPGTLIENLLVAQHQHLKSGVFAGLLKTPAFRRAEAEALARAAEWLERVGLLEMANRSAGNLAYGQQRRLEIARCMVTRPELLMLDEPAAGLNPKETDELDHLIVELRDRHKVSVLLIEHDMKLVMGISDRIYVVNQGTPLAQGTPAEIRNNPDVIRAYLGEE